MLSLSILLMILVMSLRNNINSFIFSRVAALSLIYAGVLTFNALHVQSIGSGIGIFCGLFHVTYSTLLFELFLYFIAAMILLTWPLVLAVPTQPSAKLEGLSHVSIESHDWQSLGSEKEIGQANGVYHGLKESRHKSLLSLFSVLGGSFLISSSDFLTMYLSLELQSFAVYILASLYRERLSASTAGLKYFLLGGLSSSIILLGIALVYSLTGITSFDSLFSFMSVFSSLGIALEDSASVFSVVNVNIGLYLGLALIVLGFLFKLAGAPFHNWAPDVYDSSPSNITIWLTIMPKISLIIFLLEFCGYVLPQGAISPGTSTESFTMSLESLDVIGLALNILPSMSLRNIFLVSSLLSLVIGTVLGLYQTRLKRLLAFSTISHMGFLLLGLAINTEQSMLALLFYLIQYSITTLNVFSIVLGLGYLRNPVHKTEMVNPDITYIQELKGLFLTRPLLSISLVLSLFSMAGVPPLIGFFGKQLILLSAMQSGFYFMALLAIILSVLSASYYLKIVNVLITLEKGKDSHSRDLVPASAWTDGKGLGQANLKNKFIVQTLKRLVLSLTQAQKNNISTLQESSFENIKLSLIEENLEKSDKVQTSYVIISEVHAFIIAVLSLLIILFFLKPTLILNSALLCALTTYYI